MSLKSQIETAKDAVSKALITALENKDEQTVIKLFTCYTELNAIDPKDQFKFDLCSGGIYTNEYNIPYSSNSDDVISFSSLS